MKIVIETKEDKTIILTAMDCVARHMGYQGLPIQNAINIACEGLDCAPKLKAKDTVAKKGKNAS